MKEHRNKIFGATLLTVIITLMISVGTMSAQLTQEATVEQIVVATPTIPMVPYEPTGGGLGVYPCLIICGVPYVIIVTILAFLGQGMPIAMAMVLAGATAAMIACVAICLGGGGGGGSYDECPCHQSAVTQDNLLQ